MAHYFTHVKKGSAAPSACVHCGLEKKRYEATGRACTRSEPIKYRPPAGVVRAKRGCQGLYCATQAEHIHRGENIVYL